MKKPPALRGWTSLRCSKTWWVAKWFGLRSAGAGHGHRQAWCIGTASRGHFHYSVVRAVLDADRLLAESNIGCDLSGYGWIVIDDVGGLFL